jgi:hypothetical protein
VLVITTQDTQETDFHDPGGIRTHNPSKRAGADPRLRLTVTDIGSELKYVVKFIVNWQYKADHSLRSCPKQILELFSDFFQIEMSFLSYYFIRQSTDDPST